MTRRNAGKLIPAHVGLLQAYINNDVAILLLFILIFLELLKHPPNECDRFFVILSIQSIIDSNVFNF